ncbi:juvenile hormone esterase-like [Homarus americanus]|uniref:juvenile hormone esterase-like n=1 Tax=Homarus americanus TaxID=6706 RepID=UPI001C44C5EB|nr:juvenile hormone esterase-like [Homarus americanus]XP_042217573.1 juvenile hormone esterase-like [Homarus americanus]
MMKVLLWLLVVAVVTHQQTENTVKIELQQGVIIGSREEADAGRFIYSFKGIPYAEPPVGDLRMKDPLPAGGWTGERNGTEDPPVCKQIDIVALFKDEEAVVGDEDCLFLNVFTPRPYSSDLPVMVYIHGGAFILGSMIGCGPLPLLNKDVVLVAIQYRLGVLGFLSTEDEVLPGNLGLKDQTVALRWVQENIRSFGGDPEKVTIFGESAGSASVHFQILTPHAAGLFQQAIMQSGTALCPWALREDHKEVAVTLGEMYTCSDAESPDLDSNRLLDCLNEVPVDDLILSQLKFFKWGNFPWMTLPRVDGNFLLDHPASMLSAGRYNKVNIMAGINLDEGSIIVIDLFSQKRKTDLNMLNATFPKYSPVVLGFEEWEERPEYLAQRVFHHYLGGDIDLTEGQFHLLSQMFGDRFIKTCHEDAAYFHSQNKDWNVYLYELRHQGQQNLPDALTGSPSGGNGKVNHGDDLQYLFSGMPPFQPLQHSGDLFLSEIMVDLWTNFAATGNPTPDGSLGFRWTPATKDNMTFLSLTTVPIMDKEGNQEIQEFWRNLPTKQNKLLFPERFIKDKA